MLYSFLSLESESVFVPGCPDGNSDLNSSWLICGLPLPCRCFFSISSSGTLLLRLDLLHLYDKFVADLPKESQDFGKAKPADRFVSGVEIEGC